MNENIGEDSSLADLLKEDTAETGESRDPRERPDEYTFHLYKLEHTIAQYYYGQDQDLTDNDVVMRLFNIMFHLENKISYFSHPLELSIIATMTEVFKESPLTSNEFEFVLDYVIKSVKNRSWLPGKRAYLKWICYFLRILEPEDEDKYVKSIKRKAKQKALSRSEIDILLLRSGEAPE
jgi:5-hydroxyisourate hydrolase-like protein (transthyretin family)